MKKTIYNVSYVFVFMILGFSLYIQNAAAQNSCENFASMKKVPLGGKESGSGEITCYKIYVPTKWGGILTVKVSGGSITDLKYPDGSAYTNGSETGLGKHGWYTFKVTGQEEKHEVSNIFIQSGITKVVPWNFWYFPLRSADTRRLLFDIAPNEGAMKKYDKLVGGTAAYDWETDPANGHKDPAGVAAWFGHCGGAATASILYEQPNAPAVNPHGFAQDEIEGLLSELGRLSTDTTLESGWPGEKPAIGADNTDKYADNFHRRLRRFIRQKRKPLLMDLRRSDGTSPGEKWNQAIYKYVAKFEEDPGGGGNEKKILITNIFTANEDFLDPNNKTGASTGNPENSRKREQEAIYTLKYKANGAINRTYSDQDWKSMKKGATSLYIPRYIIDVDFPIAGGKGDNPKILESTMENRLGVVKNSY